MITVTKKDLVTLGYGPSFASDIIREAKKIMVTRLSPKVYTIQYITTK